MLHSDWPKLVDLFSIPVARTVVPAARFILLLLSLCGWLTNINGSKMCVITDMEKNSARRRVFSLKYLR